MLNCSISECLLILGLAVILIPAKDWPKTAILAGQGFAKIKRYLQMFQFRIQTLLEQLEYQTLKNKQSNHNSELFLDSKVENKNPPIS